jgi:phage shock protein PspC (stress-responsive transcriptional regulator)
MEKRLCKSRRNKIIAGVCGGIAEFFNISPFIIRIIFVFSSGATVFIYLILALFLPYDEDDNWRFL